MYQCISFNTFESFEGRQQHIVLKLDDPEVDAFHIFILQSG